MKNEIKIQQKELLDWYDAQRRILPWREDLSPYHVWLSEIMLQQTRVEAVIEAYHRFLQALPDVAALASAGEDQLLKLWEGLGYYSRIRNMHKAAVRIMEDFHGTIPSTSKELIRLPGIGPYTAAAIASIAFGEAVPSIDGNLLRVFSRMTAWEQSVKEKSTERAAASYYQGRIPAQRPGDFNQALMDLGATICLPHGRPLCERCPWSVRCVAHQQHCEEAFPILPAKKKRTVETKTVLLIHDHHRWVLRKRPESGLLAGLYEFPCFPGTWTRKQIQKEVQEMGLFPLSVKKKKTARHIFTHKEWHMTGYEILVKTIGREALLAVTPDELRQHYSLPSAFSAFVSLLP